MHILALDAALARCSAAVLIDGTIAAEREDTAGPGRSGRSGAALLPLLAEAVLADSGVAPTALDGVAATVGPGSFTGLRAALALAQGLALAAGRPAIGVTVGEAFAEGRPGQPDRALWTAIASGRSGRVFLDTGGQIGALALEALPMPGGGVALAGDAAALVAAWLAARGADVQLTDARRVRARDVAAVAARRLSGSLPPLPAQPLYIDPPQVRLAAGGARPAPVAAQGGIR
jgi:tRNA threonylcarbamoyl adenosine modification protein YeaZ